MSCEGPLVALSASVAHSFTELKRQWAGNKDEKRIMKELSIKVSLTLRPYVSLSHTHTLPLHRAVIGEDASFHLEAIQSSNAGHQSILINFSALSLRGDTFLILFLYFIFFVSRDASSPICCVA